MKQRKYLIILLFGTLFANQMHAQSIKQQAHPPIFNKTGKLAKAIGVTYAVDMPVNSETNPSQTFNGLLGSFHYFITSKYIRVELSGAPSLAKGFVDALGGGITIIDIQARKSYTISNYLNMIPVAVVKEVNNFQDVFGMADFYQKLLRETSIKAVPLANRTFDKYHVSGVLVEIPVKQRLDKNGKPDNGLLYLHCLLSGNWSDYQNKNYDPKFKLFLEMYYTHDLDNKIPPAVISSKGLLGFDGFFAGFKLKDESGKQVTYAIANIEYASQIDEGMFQIPNGYSIMTQNELDQQVRKRLGMKN